MEPILDDLVDLGKTVTFSPPDIPIVSAVYGNIIDPGNPAIFTAQYFAEHARRPVLFHKSIQSIVARDAELATEGVWLEIGPHAMILPLLKMQDSIKDGCVQIGSLQRGEADGEALCKALSRLYCAGVSANWQAIFQGLDGKARE